MQIDRLIHSYWTPYGIYAAGFTSVKAATTRRDLTPGFGARPDQTFSIVRTLCSSPRHRNLHVAALGRVSITTCYSCDVASIAFVHTRDRDDLVLL